MTRPAVLPIKHENIPAQLREQARWVLWRNVRRKKPDGSFVWAKMPYAAAGTPGSSTDAKTWCTYDEAADAHMLGDYDGLGFVLGDGLHGIDLDDCRDPVTGLLNSLALEVLEKVQGYAEVSPSGTGIKIFTPTNLDGSRTKKEMGVELYRDGRYFTVTGHVLDAGHADVPVLVQDLGWFVEMVWAETMSADSEERALELYKRPLDDWELDRVVDEVLVHMDPDCGYEDWLKIGAALHHQGGGDVDWLQAWDEWSAVSGKWVEGYCADKWDSFSEQRAVGRGAITLASLLHMTKDKRHEAELSERDVLMKGFGVEIDACADPRELQEKIAAKIAHTAALSDVERELLAASLQKKAKDLGVKLPITTVRGWVRAKGKAGNASMPDWAEVWVYVTDGDKFFNLQTKQEVTPQGFRALYNRLMPLNQDGNREKADQYALEQWGMKVVSHKAYMPAAAETFDMFGLEWVNMYRPESVPEVPATASQSDLDAIETVKLHLNTYLADQRERDLLLSFIAWNVQHPGVKVRWAPYIHGVPGDGKSFFSELVAVAMGGQNVRMLNGSTLESNFTDWAVGYAMVAIEEMKQHGHNRYDIMNRVKPVITNTTIEVHPKGKASYTAPNVSNYMIFSNYLDGAPVDEGDRRYMFLSSQLTSERARELTEAGYFKTLFDAVQGHAGAIRAWLLTYGLHPEFDANGRAPDTAIKNTVIEMSKSDLECAAEELIENGIEGVGRDVISSAHFTRALTVSGAEAPSTTRVNSLLTKLGFRFAFRKKWKSEACRIWVRQGLGLSEADALARLNAGSGAFMDFLE
ncbi:Primase, C-terminal 2 [uncultured Caudovirales phage]|uniref:Primase, C-terminal 2 n=1 Tax=uncultured Caudovirales phage TaxID=2100421 RepID=A0A6J5NR29_9CAUD|nr:Primase, C-terminal 2 [uncultured Caudovirales phage]